MTLEHIHQVYAGSSGEATAALYRELEKFGAAGEVALNLFRACKCSERAKLYRRRGHRAEAYDRKQWSMNNLCAVLLDHAEALGIRWGWKVDPVKVREGSPHHHVLYVETPHGQVSYHTDSRCSGPEFDGEWDRAIGCGPERICKFVAEVLGDSGDGKTQTQPAGDQHSAVLLDSRRPISRVRRRRAGPPILTIGEENPGLFC
jgi:hypothetical protein